MTIRISCVILLAVLLVPVTVLAQEWDDKRHLIAEIDRQVEQAIRKRKVVVEEMKQIDAWTRQAGNWMEEQSRLQQKVNQARQRQADYATMNSNQLQDELKSLEDSLAAVIQPPGGRVIGNKRYHHIQDAYTEMIEKSNELPWLQTKEHNIIQEMLALDTKRDELVRQAEESTGKFVKGNNELLAALRNARAERQRQVDDPKIWCEQHDSFGTDMLPKRGPIICRDRRMVLIHMGEQYRDEIKNSGKPYDYKELAARINRIRDESNQTKKMMREKIIPLLDDVIYDAEKLGHKAKIPNVDLSGCWFLWMPGNGNRKAVLTIASDGGNGYKGRIDDYGWLDLPNGHILFHVARINATTFDGTEYSIVDGSHTRTRLRLIVDKFRGYMTYRTKHDMVTLSPCN